MAKSTDDSKLQIYIGNIPHSCSEDIIADIFQEYNIVSKKYMQKENKVFCFLQLKQLDDVIRAVQNMNDIKIDGRNLRVRAMDQTLQNQLEMCNNCDDVSSMFSSLSLKEGHQEKMVETSSESSSAQFNKRDPRKYKSKMLMTSEERNHRKCDATSYTESLPREGRYLQKQDSPPPLEFVSGDSVHNNLKSTKDCLQKHLNSTSDNYRNSYQPDLHQKRYTDKCSAFNQRNFQDNYDYAQDYESEDTEFVKLWVANFPYGTTEKDLYALFEAYQPLDIYVELNVPTGRREDFTRAIVLLPSLEFAESAIMELDNTLFKRRTLIVCLAEDDDEVMNSDIARCGTCYNNSSRPYSDMCYNKSKRSHPQSQHFLNRR